MGARYRQGQMLWYATYKGLKHLEDTELRQGVADRIFEDGDTQIYYLFSDMGTATETFVGETAEEVITAIKMAATAKISMAKASLAEKLKKLEETAKDWEEDLW